jgi:hypothetical protein
MAPPEHTPRRSPIRYDRVTRRVWLFGQRCHHGATGTLLTVAAVSGLVTSRLSSRGIAALAATGGLLMAHDWHDRSCWFARGPQD